MTKELQIHVFMDPDQADSDLDSDGSRPEFFFHQYLAPSAFGSCGFFETRVLVGSGSTFSFLSSPDPKKYGPAAPYSAYMIK